jgi:general secretion pathway protein E/type IV pilus assembly protein PilB
MAEPTIQTYLQGQPLVDKIRALTAERLKVADPETLAIGSQTLDQTFIEEGKIEDTAMLAIYAEASGLPALDEQETRDVPFYPDVTYDFLNANVCLPLLWNADRTILALASPYEAGHIAQLWRSLYETDVELILARRSFIDRFLASNYDRPDETLGAGGAGDSEQALRDLAKEAPIVRLVNDIFTRAQETGTSDIHIEPNEKDVQIRFRIDGMLQTVLRPPIAQFPAISSRIKLLSNMNIAERRLPQDGRIELSGGGMNSIDVRVSTIPTMHGESIVLRLLQKDSSVFELDKVGLLPDTMEELTALYNMPHGMILIVGPTGSGKTTTLYCIMKQLNADFRKIITIEDPVEYQLEGLQQIQVRANIGLTFASGLRAIVRQDPDVVLVGEIRDKETAEIAIHASLTGHLVLSTLHTNDAAGAISRLVEMGVEGFLISSALLAVASQRLVRRICPECHGAGYIGDPTPENPRGKRCRNCMGSGYRGRIAIFELMVINDELRAAINQHQDTSVLNQIAKRHGMRSLKEDGDLKVQKGLTTASEVMRVCQLDLGDLG